MMKKTKIKIDPKKKMNIHDVVILKDKLNEGILKAINEFEDITETKVKDIVFIEHEDDEIIYIDTVIEL